MESVGNALHNIEISIHNLEEAVDKVGTASGEIVDIIKLIGDIAEETNLLSLMHRLKQRVQGKPDVDLR